MVARVLYVQKWKTLILPTIEEWLVMMIDFAALVKVTSLITEKALSTFIANCKPLFVGKGKNELMI